jgi:Fe-S cluster assembly protein SufD
MNIPIEKYRLPNIASYLLTFVDGRYTPELSDTQKIPTQLILISALEAKTKSANNIKSFFKQEIAHDGYFLLLEENYNTATPIHILFISTGKGKKEKCNYQNLIIAEKNARATIIEEYIYLNNTPDSIDSFTQIITQQNSQLAFYKLQNESFSASHASKLQIKQEENSNLFHYYFSKGTAISDDLVTINLNEINAKYHSYGLLKLNNQQTHNYQLHAIHSAPNCQSNITFKGIINDQASGNFTGRILIEKTAAKSETHLTNKNILQSEHASMTTSPELEIYTDDVICTHGATVGQLDDKALFYLRTRGIDEPQAKNILLEAFANEIIDHFDDPVKTQIRKQQI